VKWGEGGEAVSCIRAIYHGICRVCANKQPSTLCLHVQYGSVLAYDSSNLLLMITHVNTQRVMHMTTQHT
jgi:hypothetical protein